jgi:glycosyltransferase involved in cell wall biosynthesis
MKILFIHQNFPGQFPHLAPALASRGHEVVALGTQREQVALPGVRYFVHCPTPPAQALPPGPMWEEWAAKLVRGHSCALAMARLQSEGFTPDVVLAHPGWGEALYVKDVFPRSKLLVYAEYYYGAEGGDSFFDPEFTKGPSLAALERLRIKNTHLLHALAAADGALAPTEFQRSRHPVWAQDKITVIHDGIDTARFRPDPNAEVALAKAGVTLRHGDEVVTFVARHLEPYRGYHIFMRALPHLQALRPKARIVIVGGDGVSYGAKPPEGQSWKDIFLREVRKGLDMERIHYVGTVPHPTLQRLLQVSALHTYLTYPFVLSWSLLEAMSMGCLVVGSRTAPLEEVVSDGTNGILTDFFDPKTLAQRIATALEKRSMLQPLREAARRTVIDRFDLQSHCLPRLIQWVESGGNSA